MILNISISRCTCVANEGNTHTHTRHIGAHRIEKWHHMPAFCDCTFDAGIESIAGEEGQDIRLPGELRV
jgi:hypothetical protein